MELDHCGYYSILEALVPKFIDLYPACILEQSKVRPHKGASKLIVSYRYHDHFQVDLVDYHSDPQYSNPQDPELQHNPVCQWLMVVKDHLSRVVYAKPIPRKSPIVVAYELTHIFSFIGYPLVFHTDNGLEFGKNVIRAMKNLNPHMKCVTGRCCTPHDQGSIEQAN